MRLGCSHVFFLSPLLSGARAELIKDLLLDHERQMLRECIVPLRQVGGAEFSELDDTVEVQGKSGSIIQQGYIKFQGLHKVPGFI